MKAISILFSLVLFSSTINFAADYNFGPSQKSPNLKQSRTSRVEEIKLTPLFKEAINQKSKVYDPNKKSSGGGWGSSGGGSGIACFSDAVTAKKVKELARQNRPIPDSLIMKIQELQTLDYWEWKERLGIQIQEGKSVQSYLNEAHKNLARLVPLFVLKLQQAAQLIEFQNWEAEENIATIHDTKITRQIPENCAQVQIVARLAEGRYDNGEGPTKVVPKVKLLVNFKLFEKLDSVNQAILVFHEQLYLLGQLTGHTNSDLIRKITMILFNPALSDVSPVDANRFGLRANLVTSFGDYFNFFADENVFSGPIYSQESRYNSFYFILSKIRAKLDLCSKGLLPDEQKSLWLGLNHNYTCGDHAHNVIENMKWMTDEMAFVYYVHFVMDTSMQAINAEYFYAPFADGEFNNKVPKIAEFVCSIIKRDKDKTNFPFMTAKVLNYCDGLIEFYSKKTNQN